jgi:hypothetical protein
MEFAEGGAWALNHVHYTTREGVTVPPLGLPTGSVPLTTDPPEHKFYRRALQSARPRRAMTCQP